MEEAGVGEVDEGFDPQALTSLTYKISGNLITR